ncbi:MFS transporter [Agromyces sp. SYSU T00194]|uniref:MFS transporter n=1 Tax=Agromyces chitinivorans TaxID=3158560 RepID=UPI0033910452
MTDDPADARGGATRRVLRLPAFRAFLAGAAASNVGTWFQDIAAAIVIFQATGSATLVAVLAVCAHGTTIAFAPLGGDLADRFDRRRLLVAANAAQGVAAAVLAALAFAGAATVPAILAVAFALGIGRAVNNPALQSLVPAIVERRDIAQATALVSMTYSLARVIGPVLGAAVVALAGAGPAFAVNATSFLLFAALLLGFVHVPRSAAAGRRGGILGGIRVVRRRPRIGRLLGAGVLVGIATDPAITLGPALADAFDAGTARAGWFVAAFGAGAVLVSPFVGRLRDALGPDRTSLVALVLVGAAFAGVAVVGATAAAAMGAVLVLFAVAGVGFLLGNSDVVAGIQDEVDDEVRGRVLALWSMAFVGSRPLGALLDGALADALGPTAAVGATGALVLVGVLVLTMLRRSAAS